MRPVRPAELLVLCSEAGSVSSLSAGLRNAGCEVDVVTDLDALRRSYFARGGHDALVLAADVHEAIAQSATHCLRQLDGALAVFAFGAAVARSSLPSRVTRLSAHHPATRAGLNALLRGLGDTGFSRPR